MAAPRGNTKRKGGPSPSPFDPLADPLTARVAAGLVQVASALRARTRSHAGERALTPTQGQMLARLQRHAPDGLTLTSLARALVITPATASGTLTTLERKGLVRKQRAARDARALAIALTARGRRAATQAQSWSAFLAARLEVLDEHEQQVVLRALVKLLRSLQEHGEIPVARVCPSCRFFRAHAHDDSERPHHCAFVDAPFGERSLRLDCPDHEPASADTSAFPTRAGLARRPGQT